MKTARDLSKLEKSEIDENTIKAFEDFSNKYLKKTSEENKMEKENEITTETVKTETETPKEEIASNPFDDIISNMFVKLEKDKAKYLLLTNWKIVKIDKFKDEKTGLPKIQDEFSALCLSEDGTACNKNFTTTSINCIIGLSKVFSRDWPRTDIPHLVRIKRLNEGKATIYDVEEQPIQK